MTCLDSNNDTNSIVPEAANGGKVKLSLCTPHLVIRSSAAAHLLLRCACLPWSFSRGLQFEVEAKELELNRLLAEEGVDTKAADKVCLVCVFFLLK